MDTYSLNPVIFPQKAPLPANHHRTVVGAVVAAVLVLVVAIVFWSIASQRNQPPLAPVTPNRDAALHAETATQLRASTVQGDVTSAQLDSMAAHLLSSKVKPTEEEQTAMAASLREQSASMQNY